MTLLTPALAIAGLCAIAIPILIHLLMRQRRRPIEFAAMRFLIEAFRKHKRRLRLEQMILLAVRCLILGLLGLALARPLLKGSTLIEQGGSRSVMLVIDDGLVSGALGDDQRPALTRHIDQAVDIVRSLGPGDTVSVISAATPAKALLSPPSSDHGAVISLLQSLSPKQSPSDLPGAMAFVREAATDARDATRPTLVYLLSDFRTGSAALDSPLPSTQADVEGSNVKLLAAPPAIEPLANVQITAIEPVRTLVIPKSNDGSEQVKVRLERHGGQLGADVTRVRLTGEGLPPIEAKVVQWQPGDAQAEVEFMIDYGLSTDRKVALTATIDDDRLNADNSRLAVLDLRSQLRVLLIDRRSFGFERTLDQLTAGQWIRRALEPMEGGPIALVEAEPAALDVADLRTADVAFAPRPDLISESGWGLLRQFVDRGGLLMIMPPAEVTVHQWTAPFAHVMGLPWRMALETVEHPEGLAMAVEQPPSEMLRLISSDVGELARPILAYRVLPIDDGAEAPANGDASAGAAATTLLAFADGSPILVMGSPVEANEAVLAAGDREGDAATPPARSSAGVVLYLAVAPEVAWTNLPTKPLMVPLVNEIVRQGLSLIRASQKAQVGEQPTIAQAGPAARDLQTPDGRSIPLTRAGKPERPLEAAGVYTILDETKQSLGLLAVNVDPSAGATNVQSEASVAAWLGKSGPWSTFEPERLAATLGGGGAGSPISGILLTCVLALAILETMLARWFSHAKRADASGDHLALRPSMSGGAG